jgi:hypothetical protein
MTRLKWKLILVCLEIVLILTQDSCTVCAERTLGSKLSWTQDSCTVCVKRTIGSKTFLMHAMVLLGYEAQEEARFGVIRDGAKLDAR